MTEKEARMILEHYQMTDEDTGESYGHPVIRCVGPDEDGFIFECKSNGYLDLSTCLFVEDPNATYEVAVYPGGDVVVVPQ